MSFAVTTMESIVTVTLTLGIIMANTLILLVILWTESFRNINKICFCSLTVSDLCVGLFVTPFAVFSTFTRTWIYNDEIFCHIEAYLLPVFVIAGTYSLAWLSVDHYLAVRKPQRHKTALTPIRSLCWILLAWIAALSFCSPPLFSFEMANYYKEVYMCSIQAGPQKPYFVTAGIIVLFPAIITLMVTNAYIFTRTFRKKRYTFEAILLDTATRPQNYFMNFIITVIFFISWLPWLFLQIYGVIIGDGTDYPHTVHFYFLWFAMGNSFYKFIVYLFLSGDFRKGLIKLCGNSDCRCPQCSLENNLNVNFIVSREK